MSIITWSKMQIVKTLGDKEVSIKFIVTDSKVLERAQSLGYTTAKLDDVTVAIKLPTEILVCSTERYNLVRASNLFTIDNLVQLDIRELDTSQVTDMHRMFSMCSFLKELDLSNFNTEKVINMQNMFYMCKELKALDISSFSTEKVKDMSYIFKSCKSLEEIDISNFRINKDTQVVGMFNNCEKLKMIYINRESLDKILLAIESSKVQSIVNYTCKINYKYNINKIIDIGDNKLAIEISIQSK